MTHPNSISLKKAIEFHGHLGPWLVLGLITGKYILENLKARKHFGLVIKTYGLSKKPKTCLLDGLQLSTGCTMGKSNLSSVKNRSIKIVCINKDTKNKIVVRFKKNILLILDSLKDHQTSEKTARKFYRMKPCELLE